MPDANTGTTPPGAAATETTTRRRPVAWGIGLVAAGVLWLGALAGVAIPWRSAVAIGLVVVGLMVLFTPSDSVRDGFVALGIVLVIIALIAPFTPRSPLSAGEVQHAPVEFSEVRSDYSLGAGSFVLDMRDLDFAAGEGTATPIRVRVGMGELVVRVPDDVRVTVNARVGMGEARAFDRNAGGIAPALDVDDGPQDAVATVDLHLRVGLGQIRVDR